LEPDAKSQVTLRYANERPVEATAIVVSTQHAPGYYWHNGEGDEAKYATLRDYVKSVIADVMPAELLTANTVYHINPTGRFEIGGPDGDAGLPGRKIIVDTYGGASPHGGGALSGKDPTEVARSAAYVTRYLAKNIVAAGLARRCTIQLSYAIGVAEPLSIYVDLHGTGTVEEGRIEAAIPGLVRLTPKGIRTHLGPNKPIYRQTAAYGHFGRTPDGHAFPWDRTDPVHKPQGAAAAEARGAATRRARLDGRATATALRAGEQDVVDRQVPQIAVPEGGEVSAERLVGQACPLHFEIGFGGGGRMAGRADRVPDHG